MDDKRNEKKEKEIKTSVYSLRLTKKQKDVLKKNKWIKDTLDKMVLDYINNYL